MTVTVDDFINQVKATGVIPENQALITTPRILAFADEEISNELVPMLDSVNQNYFVRIESEPLVSGTAEYNIPYRAIGRKLRDLKMTQGTTTRSLVLIALEDAHFYNQSGQTNGFYFRGDKLVLLPTPTDPGYSLDKYYSFRPSKLIQMSDAGKILNISGNVLTLSAVPIGFSPGYLVDTVQGKSGYQTLSFDIPISSLAGNIVTLPSLPFGLAIGDYVCEAEKSPVIQLPDECFSYLVARTVKRVLQSIGDFEGVTSIKDDLAEKKRNLLMLMEPRIEGESTVLIKRNGLLRAGRQVRYFRGILG